MSRLLHTLGRASAEHPWRVLSAWLLAAAVLFGLAGRTAESLRTTGTYRPHARSVASSYCASMCPARATPTHGWSYTPTTALSAART
jgi:hypothetical protein